MPVGEKKVGVAKARFHNAKVSDRVFFEWQVGAVRVNESGVRGENAASELYLEDNPVDSQNGEYGAPKARLGRKVFFTAMTLPPGSPVAPYCDSTARHEKRTSGDPPASPPTIHTSRLRDFVDKQATKSHGLAQSAF